LLLRRPPRPTLSPYTTLFRSNPRTSRSSALASKATGFPIALISAMLASGVTLDELPYWKGGSLDKYQPGGDYVVVKFAKWAFEKDRKSTRLNSSHVKISYAVF